MKLFPYLLALPLISGCLATMPNNPSRIGGSGITGAIVQYDNEHPSIKRICVALDSGFKYSVGEYVLEKNSMSFEDVYARWEHLVRLGLFTKQDAKGKVIYKIAQPGRASYNDDKCLPSVNPVSAHTGPALIYGSLEFDQVVKTERNPYTPIYTTVFKKRFTRLESWATDKEFRRAWKLQGVEEVQNFRWFATYRVNSNGIDFIDQPRLFLNQY